MFRALAPYVPPALTAAILGSLALHEFDHLAPEKLKLHLKPLLGRRREPPEEFAGDAAPQVGVFAGNDRAHAAVLVVQATPRAERKLVARTAARACSQWNSKDVDISLGLSPRVWEAVKGQVPLGNVASNATNFRLTDRTSEQSRTQINNTGGDVFVHIKADSQGKCVEVVRAVLKELESVPLSWSEDIYGYTGDHSTAPICPTTSSWAHSNASLCKIACVPHVGSSFVLFQRWEDDLNYSKLKSKPAHNHPERMKGMDQDGNKLSNCETNYEDWSTGI